MKSLLVVLTVVLSACGASSGPIATAPSAVAATAAAATSGPSATSAAVGLGLTIGEFQDRWNASIGTDTLRMTQVTDTATGFESLITPRIRVSGTTDDSGTVTEAQVTWKPGDVEGGRDSLDAASAFGTLPAVVGLTLTEDQANNALTELDWPSREDGLVQIDVDGVIGGVRYTAQDEGPVGIVMTAEPAE